MSKAGQVAKDVLYREAKRWVRRLLTIVLLCHNKGLPPIIASYVFMTK